jgi:hypothetical protein
VVGLTEIEVNIGPDRAKNREISRNLKNYKKTLAKNRWGLIINGVIRYIVLFFLHILVW